MDQGPPMAARIIQTIATTRTAAANTAQFTVIVRELG